MQTWGLTDPGNIRQQNQDSYAIMPFGRDRVLMIICDGMGGAKSGNVASSLAVEVFTDEVRRTQRAGMTPEKAAAMLRSALELANSAVFEQSQLSDDFTGMGTTLVAVWISRDLAVVINVGDSRAYHFTREDVRLITRDHSMVAYMVERGELTQEQAKLHPGKNVITRAVGTEPEVEGDVFTCRLAFYAVKAVLALEEVDFKRHKDAVAYFNKTYVATDIFPREIGKKLGRLKQERETSDYDDFYISLQPLDIFVIYNDVCYLFPHHPFLMTHFLIHNIFPA